MYLCIITQKQYLYIFIIMFLVSATSTLEEPLEEPISAREIHKAEHRHLTETAVRMLHVSGEVEPLCVCCCGGRDPTSGVMLLHGKWVTKTSYPSCNGALSCSFLPAGTVFSYREGTHTHTQSSEIIIM